MLKWEQKRAFVKIYLMKKITFYKYEKIIRRTQLNLIKEDKDQ